VIGGYVPAHPVAPDSWRGFVDDQERQMSDAVDPSGRGPHRRTRPTTEAGVVRRIHATGFVLTYRSIGDTDRISVAGELNATTAGLLDAETAEGCRPGAELVLDLTAVTFLDVMGVAALRRAHYRAALQGGLRLGLPVAGEPGRLLALGVDHGWLPPTFRPGVPVF
jgi:anti-sigma B factor antagonist